MFVLKIEAIKTDLQSLPPLTALLSREILMQSFQTRPTVNHTISEIKGQQN